MTYSCKRGFSPKELVMRNDASERENVNETYLVSVH